MAIQTLKKNECNNYDNLNTEKEIIYDNHDKMNTIIHH